MMRNTRLFPLTNAQKSIWHIVKFYPDTTFVNIALTVRIRESVQYQLLNRAINIAIKHNDGMRTRIVENGKEPQQYFAEYRERHFEFLDFGYPNGMEDLRRWEETRCREKIELLDSDLYDFALIKISDQEGAFFIKCHHIAADAWSITLLVRQILHNYLKLKENDQVFSQEQPSYQGRILSEHEYYGSERFEKHRLFWNQSFSTVPEFITFNNGTVVNRTDADRKTYILPRNLTLLINEFSSLNKVSPFCILFSALTMCVWKLTSKTDIVVGTSVLNRSGVKEKNTMGMFISNVPFRVKLNPDLDFTTLVKSVGQKWKTLLKHQKYPFDLVLKSFRETHGVTGKLVDVSLSFQNAKFEVDDIDYNVKWLFNGSEINSLTIHVNDREGLGNYIIDYDYLTDVFSGTDISHMHEYLYHLLNNSLTNPGSEISGLKMLSPEQERTLLLEFNDTKHDYPQQETVVSQFERQVAIAPEKIAVIFENNAFTYKELNDRSNQLAKFLRSKGVKKDSIVGLIVDRSVEMIIAILAVLKAGGAYLPIDPAYPNERIDYMLKDCNCHLLLTYLRDHNHDLGFEVNRLDLTDQNLYKESTTSLEDGPMPADLACVIYTSGSTGAPKGVMVEHRGLNNLVYSFSDIITTGNKTVLAISTVSFDMFFVETIFPIVTGMRVILANQKEATVPYLLLELIGKYKVNFLQTTPSRMKLILNDSHADKLGNLTEIILGGESFPEQLLGELKKATNARIFNGYGPTEATVCSAIKHLGNEHRITIGKPLANTQIYILDESMRPVPIGVTGEIYISGLGLARGYVNNEELTRERFIPNPFVPSSRMYKTGDLARWLSNGEIEYIGRNDNQVKIRGFRIELGEIENRLAKHELIKEAIVVCKEDKAQKKYLCAYLTARGGVSSSDLREYLSHFLPDYMIPSHFFVLESLPLTPNGKVDKQALPEPDSRGEHERKYAAPRNQLEEKLAQLWQESLEIAQVGIDDNLFALGGDSLTVLEILSGLFPNDWGLSAQDFYDYPSIRRLSDKITGALVSPESPKQNAQASRALSSVPIRQVLHVNTGNILLTGATGFLGIHILHELLSTTSDKIYCLIRGQEPEKRFYELVKFYFPFLSKSLLNERLVIISGDISQEHLGLSESAYRGLAQDVTTVIHAAALVKHYGNYDEFHRLNVKGTQEIINFCANHDKKLNCISTMSVSGNYLVDNSTNDIFTENDLYIGQNYHNNVYVRSKFEAENLIVKASQDGLNATIFRVGVLTGRYTDGQFQKNIEQNAFYRLLKSILMLEAVPLDILQEHLEFTPVDFCAKAIVKIILANHASGPVFHVFNHKTIKVEEVIQVFKSAGASIKALPRKSFNTLLTSVSATNSGKEILSGIIADPSLKAAFGSSSGVQVDSSLTIKYLLDLGFEWPQIQGEYILKVLNYMQHTGFLNRISTVS